MGGFPCGTRWARPLSLSHLHAHRKSDCLTSAGPTGRPTKLGYLSGAQNFLAPMACSLFNSRIPFRGILQGVSLPLKNPKCTPNGLSRRSCAVLRRPSWQSSTRLFSARPIPRVRASTSYINGLGRKDALPLAFKMCLIISQVLQRDCRIRIQDYGQG